jgi:hypothetical protein
MICDTDPFKGQNVNAGIEGYFASLTWVPLSIKYPKSGERVLVRMWNGRVEFGIWEAAAGIWNYGRLLSTWQTPASWAALPALHRSP